MQLTDQPHTCENLHKAVQKGDVAKIENILEESLVYVHNSSDNIEWSLSSSSPQYINIADIMGSSPLMNACGLGKVE